MCGLDPHRLHSLHMQEFPLCTSVHSRSGNTPHQEDLSTRWRALAETLLDSGPFHVLDKTASLDMLSQEMKCIFNTVPTSLSLAMFRLSKPRLATVSRVVLVC